MDLVVWSSDTFTMQKETLLCLVTFPERFQNGLEEEGKIKNNDVSDRQVPLCN